MKKILTVISVVLVIALLCAFGCKKSGDSGDTASDTVTDTGSDDTGSSDVVTTDGGDDSSQVVTQTLSKEVATVLATLDKVKSYKYAYQSGTPESKQYFVKGNKIKAMLMAPKRWKTGEFFFNQVLMDTETKKAYAYCTDRSVCNGDMRTIAKVVTYSDYAPQILPYEFGKAIVSGEKIGEETIENKPAIIVQYKDDKDNTVKVSLNTYYGMPMRIVTETPAGVKKEIMFTQMSWNSVSDTDVEYPAEIITFSDE